VKGATIRDVARRARVSHQTVSRVINGHDSVTAETRDRVLRAIRELGYVPSAVARSLSSQRTHTLGMVTTDVSDHFFAEAVAGQQFGEDLQSGNQKSAFPCNSDHFTRSVREPPPSAPTTARTTSSYHFSAYGLTRMLSIPLSHGIAKLLGAIADCFPNNCAFSTLSHFSNLISGAGRIEFQGSLPLGHRQ